MNITQIKETCLYIQDLESAKEFYHGKLGFEIINEQEGAHVFFKAGTSVLLCFVPEVSKTKTSPPPHFAYGHQHIAFEVEKELYEEWKIKLQALDIKIIKEQTWGNGLKSFYFLDPADHVLEIVPKGVWE